MSAFMIPPPTDPLYHAIVSNYSDLKKEFNAAKGAEPELIGQIRQAEKGKKNELVEATSNTNSQINELLLSGVHTLKAHLDELGMYKVSDVSELLAGSKHIVIQHKGLTTNVAQIETNVAVEEHKLKIMQNNEAEKEVKEEVDPMLEPKSQLQNINSNKRKLDSLLDKQLAKKVKTEDKSKLCSQGNKGVDSVDSQAQAVKKESIEFENQSDETPKAMPVEDQNQSQSAMHSTVSMSQNAVGSHESLLPQKGFFEASSTTHFQSSNGTMPMPTMPVVQQQNPPNFDEDSRQISHQIMRVAANSTKDRQDCFRQLLFATVFAFESSPTCTNVEEFFRMMGERYAKK
ncbi:hypothetical protein CRE_14558 [Caenorhabditis remanei]|uniref:Uncharacterized protein n=1 Tax=Caenorhabditis remanei TaxID=31234 RepID=E3M9I4_CAERE|nr:hypothetical protein CRE_14558 [Caenorhabditis remanei]